MRPVWPLGVQCAPQRGTLSIRPEDNVVRFKPDVGPDLRRRRYTGTVHRYDFQLHMTSCELDRFEEFHRTALAAGTLTFDFPDPKTGLVAAFCFAEPYQVQATAIPGQWMVSLALYRLVS